MINAKTILICLGACACLLTGCGSGSFPTPKTLTYLDVCTSPEGVTVSENSTPELSYSVVLQHADGAPITKDEPLLLDNGTASVTVSLQCDNYSPQCFGVMVFSGGVPISCSANDAEAYCHYITSGKGMAENLDICFSPLFLERDDEVIVVIVENADTEVLKNTFDHNFACGVKLPIADGSSVKLTADDVPDMQSYVCNLREYLQGAESLDFEADLQRVLLDIKNHALHVALRMDDAVVSSPRQPIPLDAYGCIEHVYGKPAACHLDATGQPGCYTTTVFIDNQPYDVFNGSASIRWTLENTEQILSVPMELPDDLAEGNHTIFALTVADQMDGDHPIVYDSYRKAYYITNGASSTELPWDIVTVQMKNENGDTVEYRENSFSKAFESTAKDIPVKLTDGCLSMTVNHKYQSGWETRDMTLLVLYNGVVQSFVHDGKTVDRINYIAKPGDSNTWDITVSLVPSDIADNGILEIMCLPEVEYAFYTDYGDMHKTTTILTDVSQMETRQPAEEVYATVIPKVQPLPDGGEYRVSASIDYTNVYFRNGKYAHFRQGDEIEATYVATYQDIGRYYVTVLLDGEPIPLLDNKYYVTYEVTKEHQVIEFTFDLPADPAEDHKIVYIVCSPDASPGSNRYYVYHQEWGMTRKIGAPNVGEKITAYSVHADSNSVCNYVALYSETGDYCTSSNFMSLGYEYGEPDALACLTWSSLNAMPVASETVVLENYVTSCYRFKENTTHIYTNIPGGLSVRRYWTTVKYIEPVS